MDARLSLPPELVGAIATAVADQLEARGLVAAPPASPWLDVDEAAEYFRRDRQRVYDLVHQGRLKCARDGRRLLFHRERHLDAYLNGTTAGDAADADAKGVT
jgi:excisionase family DNA binding protein